MGDQTVLSPSRVKASECVSGSLDWWTPPLMETSVEGYYYSEHFPDVPLSENSNSIFIKCLSSEDMVDLADSFIQITMTIKKSNGTNLSAWQPPGATANSVGFIQLPPTSVFSACNFRLNDELLSDSFHTYNYLSYIQTILNYNSDARKSRLQLQGFYEDDKVTYTDAHTDATSCGFKTRANLTALSKKATFITNIFHGMWSQARYLPPLIPFSLEFIKAPLAFCLKSNAAAPAFKYEISKMSLFLRKIKVRPSRKLEMEQKLQKSPALYPIKNAYCKPFFIDQNEKQISFENCFQSRTIPTYCVVAFVEQSKYRGDIATSPFNFGNYSLTSLKMSLDGETFPSPKPFQPEYRSTTNPNHMREYLALFDNQIKVDSGSFITYDMFKNNGFCFYVFHFGIETSQSGDHVVPKRSGSCRLDVSFDPASANEPLVLLLYSESDEIVSIDGNRKIHRDYHL